MKNPTFTSALFLLFMFLITSCNLFDKNKDEPGSVPNLNGIVTGTTTEVANSMVGLAGVNINISKPGTPVDGMEIAIPANSFSSAQAVTVSYAEIKSHQFGQYFNPISPMINISCDGGYSSEIMSVTIPVKVPEGQIPLGFYLDDATGKLEGIPVENYTANSITLLTRHFLSGNKLRSSDVTLKSASVETNRGANIIISSISESILNSMPIIASGFKPGVDDWEFVNYGSYTASGGQCAGQNMTAMWYYFEKKASDGSLYNKFSDNANLWQDDARGYRFCSVIHNDLEWDGTVSTLFGKYIDKNQELDKLKLYTIAGAMLVTGEPQGIGIYRQTGTRADGTPKYGGHDLICYQVSVSGGKLYISDPNTPGAGQSIDFANNKFNPYMAKLNGNDASHPYPFVTYYAKTAYIDWTKIGKRWSQVLDNSIGSVAPNNFPAYTLWVKDGAGYELKDGIITTRDTLRTIVLCPTAAISFSEQNQKVTGCYVYNKDGKRIDIQSGLGDAKVNPKSGLFVKLKPGVNKLGYYIVGWVADDKDENGIYYDEFIDFKWISVSYVPLSIDPNPLQGMPAKEYKLTAKSKGSAPKSSKYVWDFGDGTSQVTVQNDSTVSHTFTKEGTFNMKVELYDNSTNKKVADATSVAQITKNGQSSKSFSYSWVRTNSSWPRYKITYNFSGTVEGVNGNQVMAISSNKYVDGNVLAEFSDYGAFKVTFTSSFTVSPTVIDTTLADGTSQKFTFGPNQGEKWFTSIFTPYTFFANSGGTFENSNSFGSIEIWGYIDEKIEKFDKDKKLYDTYSSPGTWPLMMIEFDKQ